MPELYPRKDDCAGTHNYRTGEQRYSPPVLSSPLWHPSRGLWFDVRLSGHMRNWRDEPVAFSRNGFDINRPIRRIMQSLSELCDGRIKTPFEVNERYPKARAAPAAVRD
jgi:hypothetical protein